MVMDFNILFTSSGNRACHFQIIEAKQKPQELPKCDGAKRRNVVPFGCIVSQQVMSLFHEGFHKLGTSYILQHSAVAALSRIAPVRLEPLFDVRYKRRIVRAASSPDRTGYNRIALHFYSPPNSVTQTIAPFPKAQV